MDDFGEEGLESWNSLGLRGVVFLRGLGLLHWSLLYWSFGLLGTKLVVVSVDIEAEHWRLDPMQPVKIVTRVLMGSRKIQTWN